MVNLLPDGIPSRIETLLPVAPGGRVSLVVGDESIPATAEGADARIVYVSADHADLAALRTIDAVWAYDSQRLPQTWERTTDALFTAAEARAFGEGELGEFSDFAIARARDRITEDFEQILGFKLGARAATHRQFIQRRQRAVSIPDIYVVSLSSLRNPRGLEIANDVQLTSYGFIYPELGGYFSGGEYMATYVAGVTPIPAPLKRAALAVLRAQIVSSEVDPRATAFTDQLGRYSLAVAGRRGAWYGLPEADSVLHRFSARVGSIRR